MLNQSTATLRHTDARREPSLFHPLHVTGYQTARRARGNAAPAPKGTTP